MCLQLQFTTQTQNSVNKMVLKLKSLRTFLLRALQFSETVISNIDKQCELYA